MEFIDDGEIVKRMFHHFIVIPGPGILAFVLNGLGRNRCAVAHDRNRCGTVFDPIDAGMIAHREAVIGEFAGDGIHSVEQTIRIKFILPDQKRKPVSLQASGNCVLLILNGCTDQLGNLDQDLISFLHTE